MDSKDIKLTEDQERLLLWMGSTNEPVTIPLAASILGWDWKKAEKVFQELRDLGLIAQGEPN